ncbi:MAG TPA: hypothetical protein VMH27_21755 [Puia sp.]|nr:hypothetical protein [Puia sp.]
MSEKKNILILFHGEHIAYSPTVIQLYDMLSEKYSVTITAQYPVNFNDQKLEGRNVVYHRLYHVKSRYFYLLLFPLVALFNKEARYFRKNKISYKQYFFRFLFIKRQLRKTDYARIISVDIMNLFFCSVLKRPTDFLSLELCFDEQLLPLVDTKYMNCVIIQSKERYEYLFKEKKYPTFFVQNAPAFREIQIKPVRRGLIYAGSAYNVLGFYHCLNYIRAYKDERLTVQGAIMKFDRDKVEREYSELLDDGRLIINSKYLENDEMVELISNYEIGFCFYNFDETYISDNYFNYISAPSGKMFKYLAAGVPVVCSDILGFRFVDEFKCGILVDDLSEKEIRSAIGRIRENYAFYVDNALKAARYFDFDRAIAPYLALIEK